MKKNGPPSFYLAVVGAGNASQGEALAIAGESLCGFILDGGTT